MRTTLWKLAATAALSATACKKDDQPAGGKEPPARSDRASQAPTPVGKPAGVTLEPFKLDGPELVIEAQVPAGWTARDWSGGKMFSDPDGGYYPSTVIVNPTCAGDCATIAENIQGFAATQTEMHKAASYSEVAVLAQKALPGGGLELDLQVGRPGEPPMFQYLRFELGDGWPAAASCTAMAVDKGVAFKDQLKAACASLQASKK